MEISEIREFARYMQEDRHAERKKQQETDQSYYDDTYPIGIIEDENYIIRTGYVSGMVNGVTQQLIAFSPKVYTAALTEAIENKDGTDRVAKVLNKWTKELSKQSINPFRELFKKMIGTSGEAWIYVSHDGTLANWEGKEDWRDLYPNLIPVNYYFYDPYVVFHDPSEEINGKPKRVVVKCKRTIGDILANHPNWKNEDNKELKETVDYLLYIDKETRYAEADGRPLYFDKRGKPYNGDGRMVNPYGIVPFAHRYSGYGTDDEKRDPAKLAFTRIRMMRDRIKEDSAMATDFRYNQHEQAWAVKNIYVPEGVELPEDVLKNYKRRPSTINIIAGLGGAKIEKEESSSFDAAAYAYRNMVRADLNSEYPMPMRGVSTGETSGRQVDILSGAGFGMYDSPLEACASLWAEAFDIGIKICSNPIFKSLPKGLHKGDENTYSEITVDIKKEDEQELSRKAAEWDRRYEMGLTTFIEHAIHAQGKTKEEAERLYAQTLIDLAFRKDPAFLQMITQAAAEEMGAEERLAMIREQLQARTGSLNKPPETGSQGGERRIGNIKTSGMPESEATRKEPRMSPV
jgi:hypothetical protein